MNAWLGAQSRSNILKGTINLLLKPHDRLSFYVLTAKKSQPLSTKQLKEKKPKISYKKSTYKRDSEEFSTFVQLP